jgi:polyisoprenoid-binding protein YceI
MRLTWQRDSTQSEAFMKRCLAAAALLFATAGSTLAASSTWNIDSNNSAVQFNVRHLGISNVQGAFTKMSGTVTFDDSDISKSSVSASVDTTSLDTRVTMRDNELKSDKFFNVAQFPAMTFQSTKIWKSADGSAKMTGNLTIHGVTKEVTFDVDGPTPTINQNGMMRRGAEATTKLNRNDFGVSADPGIVGDTVTITLDIEFTQPGSAGTPAPVVPGSKASRGPGG